jgi:hypothetical protein
MLEASERIDEEEEGDEDSEDDEEEWGKSEQISPALATQKCLLIH